MDKIVGTLRKRRWFIYRNEDKKEIASIRKVEDFAAIVEKLE